MFMSTCCCGSFCFLVLYCKLQIANTLLIFLNKGKFKRLCWSIRWRPQIKNLTTHRNLWLYFRAGGTCWAAKAEHCHVSTGQMVQEKTASGAEDRWWHRRSMQRSRETGMGASCRGNMPWRVPGGRVEVCGPALINLSHPGSHAYLRVTHFKLPEEEKKAQLKVSANMHIFNHGLLYLLSYHESLIFHSCIQHTL